MPICEGYDYPAKEWLTVHEAVAWIDTRTVPMEPAYAAVMAAKHVNLVLAVPADDVGADNSPNPKTWRRDRLAALIHDVLVGKVRLWGRRAIGEMVVDGEYNDFSDYYLSAKEWGELEPISPAQVNSARDYALTSLWSGSLFGYDWEGGLLGGRGHIRVNFAELMISFPPPPGESVRVGEEIVPVDPGMAASRANSEQSDAVGSQDAQLETGSTAPIGEIAEYLSPDHPSYAPKLGAAVAVWQAIVAGPDLVRNKSVKTAMVEWLTVNAGSFDLLKPDGTPNAQGIEEVAKVANWNTKGGAPRTPG